MYTWILDVLVVVVVGIHLVVSAPVPTPHFQKYKHAIVEGKDLEVECNVTLTSDLVVYWTKNSSKSHFYENGLNLTMGNIRREASGDYECHLVNTSGISENGTKVNVTWVAEVVTVDVQYPAEITMIPSSQLAHENDSVYYTCTFDANPPAHITMFNNDTGAVMVNLPEVDTGNVTIGSPKATCKNGGLIICTGYNYLNYGVNTTAIDNVTILCKPQHDPQAGGRQHLKRVPLGEWMVDFEADYVGYPPPNITWEHHGEIIQRRNQYNTRNETHVIIKHVRIEDLGDYSVTLHNYLGTYREEFTLAVQFGRPQTPYNLEFYNVTYDAVTLRWTSGFDMGWSQYFIVKNLQTRAQISQRIPDTSHNHGVDQNWTHRVTGLEGDTFNRLTVYSQNLYNYQSDDATPVQFWTPTAPAAETTTTSQQPGNSARALYIPTWLLLMALCRRWV